MSKRPTSVKKTQKISELVPTKKDLEAATGSKDTNFQLEMLAQLINGSGSRLPESLEKQAVLLKGTAEMLKGIGPKDELEGMLTVQMVATNRAAMEYLRRAMLPNQTLMASDLALKHAERLMALYTRQVEALDKHRGRGKQKITVEHVTVNAGGQAIVGAFDREAASGAKGAAEPQTEAAAPLLALPQSAETPMQIIEVADMVRGERPARRS